MVRVDAGQQIKDSASSLTEIKLWMSLSSRLERSRHAAGAGRRRRMPITDLPGRIVAPNLTPDPETGAGRWTDDQLARAIREGIGHDGRALLPMMPYQNYRSMSDEDLASVIVYLRSLPPVRNALPSTEIIFPVKYLIRGVPQDLTSPVPDPPATASQIERGALLVQLAACNACHTPLDKGRDIPGMAFAGGFAFPGSWGAVASANITPDPSGISYYDESLLLEMMRTGSVKARKLSPIMPTNVYKNLSDDDLKAIFAYLRTLKPVHHRVDNSEPPTSANSAGSSMAPATRIRARPRIRQAVSDSLSRKAC